VIASAGKMSQRESNRGFRDRRDEEKAKPHHHTNRESNSDLTTNPRLPRGASSRASQLDGIGGNTAKSSYRGSAPRSPRNTRRSRSPYRAPHSKRRTDSRSASRSRSDSRSPSASSRRGLNDRLRSRSPYRDENARTGDKRPRSSNHYHASANSDSRRFKVHYEKEKENTHRDIGQLPRGKTGGIDQGRLTHQARDDGRLSRSDVDLPVRHERGGPAGRTPAGSREVGLSYQDSRFEKANSAFSTKASSSAQSTHNQHSESKPSTQPATQEPQKERYVSLISRQPCIALHDLPETWSCVSTDQCASRDENEKSTNDVEVELVPQLTEDELIEQRRKKREAIKAKYRSQQPPLLVQALEQSTHSTPSTPHHESSGVTSEHVFCKYQTLLASSHNMISTNRCSAAPTSMDSPRTPASPSSPAAIAVTNDEELANRQQVDAMSNDDDGPSAADYDPTMDMQEDRPDHKPSVDATLSKPADKPSQSIEKPADTDKEFDMFAEDDEDDMFAPAGTAAKTPGHAEIRTLDSSLLDNWDYPDGHYRIIIGELLDGRYAVQQQIGKGTFATVVRATDTKTNQDVAVKIACNNETMYKAGTKEMDMLTELNAADREDKRHIIQLLRNFDHKGHMCLVFENLHSDLREVLKKFGRNVGINLKAIRAYGQQMFIALGHLKRCKVLHADLKPDNILVNKERSKLKICDLGTASKAEDAEITPYLVSRFYRAPEVILGMPFDYAIDMWSIGCTLFELYTGRILFAGGDNNQMLRVIQECRGKFPKRVIKNSELAFKHFIGGDPEYVFVSQERDKVTGNSTMKQLSFTKTAPGRDLKTRLTANTKHMSPSEVKELHTFVDLLEKCLQLDPAKRISPHDALHHPFILHSQSAAVATKPKVKLAMVPLGKK
jgi:serine/threonine-protein kinase PRP4